MSRSNDPFATSRAANSDPLFNTGSQFNDAERVLLLPHVRRPFDRSDRLVDVLTRDEAARIEGINRRVHAVRLPGQFGHSSRATLRVFAEQTGGIAVVNTNNFQKALQQIDSETSDYYVLGYTPTNPDPTQRRRLIEIRLVNNAAGKDLDLQYRTEYTLRPAKGR